MATDKEMAFAIGIRPESFSKRKSNQVPWTDEEKRILTELYGRSAPKSAWEPMLAIDSQAERLRTQDELIISMKSELNQYHRGTKIAWVGVAVIGMVCATIILHDYAPRWLELRTAQLHGIEILQAKITYLEMRVRDLEQLVAWYQALLQVSADRLAEVMRLITEVGE